jgi:hypothetical protein
LLAWLSQDIVSSFAESLTVIVYDLYTLDNAGHGFHDVIAQNVLFTSSRVSTVDVGFKCRAIEGFTPYGIPKARFHSIAQNAESWYSCSLMT